GAKGGGWGGVLRSWERLILRSYAKRNGTRGLYQEGSVAAMRTPDDLIKRYIGAGSLPRGTALFCGTLAVHGEIRPAERFEIELEDPVLGRKLTHGYDIKTLPDEG